MTPEERFLAEVQSAYDRYASALDGEGATSTRLRATQRSVASLVGEISEINWFVRNEREW